MINGSNNFKAAWIFAMRWESQVLEHVPGDRGGLTKYGVDQASHPHVNIAALTLDQAGQIYHDEEWTRCRCEDLPELLAIAVFDFAMVSGMAPAIRKLQTALGVKADGFIGPKTIAAGKASNESVVSAYLTLREDYFHAVVQAHPDDRQFLHGWLNRNAALRQYLQGIILRSAGSVKNPASGSVGLAAPLFLSGASLLAVGFPFLADVKPDNTLLIGSFVIAASMLIPSINIVLGWIKGKPVEAPHSTLLSPQPLVVRQADQFVTQEQVQKIETDLRHQMVELRGYMHDAVHDIKEVAHAMSLQVRESSESTRELFQSLDARNEARVEKVAKRVDEVIDRTPEKVIGLLRTTGVIK